MKILMKKIINYTPKVCAENTLKDTTIMEQTDETKKEKTILPLIVSYNSTNVTLMQQYSECIKVEHNDWRIIKAYRVQEQMGRILFQH